MKRALLKKSGMVVLDDDKKPMGPGDVSYKTIACGICEGDVVAYKNRAELGDRGQRLGHEGNGQVDAVGEEVTDIKPGDIVTCLGGGYTEFFVLPRESVAKLPDHLDPKIALGEPLACVVHAMNRITAGPDDRVAIVGCGFMGMLALQVLKHRGAGYILGVDTIEERRKHAITLGADEAMAPGEVPQVDDPLHKGNFDVVVELAGVPEAIDLCGNLVKHHGHMNIVATHRSGGGMRNVNMYQWNWKSITIHQGHVRDHEGKIAAFHEGVDLMASGAVKMDSLVKHYALDDADQAFQDLISRKPGVYKAALVP